jgi:broad specificity phosphatase PhoE
MRLILVRHGETEGNVREIFQGHLKVELTEKGKEQARKLALRLKSEDPDVIFSSSSHHAKQTCDIIREAFPGVPVNLTPEIRGRDYGTLSGILKAEYYTIRDASGVPPHLHRPEGGESSQDVQERMADFYRMLLERYTGKTVLVVTHNSAVKALLAHLLGKRMTDMENVGNASVTVVEVDEKSHRVSLVGCIKHLE